MEYPSDLKCPRCGEAMEFHITVDLEDAPLEAYCFYECPKCFQDIYAFQDEFEYPPGYDELRDELIKKEKAKTQ